MTIGFSETAAHARKVLPFIGLVLCAALAAPPAGAQEVVFTDQANREVRLPKPADRVVSIVIPVASNLIALDGGTKKLVGMNPTAKSAVTQGILGKIFPEAKDIPSDVTSPSFVPNVEALAAVNPELVVQWGDIGEEKVAPLTNAGLTTMLILYGTEELTQGYMTMAGKAIGQNERLKALIDWRDQVRKDLAAKTASIPEDEKPRALYLQRAITDMAASGTKGNYTEWSMELAGARNAAAELVGTVSINKEQVAAWNPDVIFLNAFEAELDPSWVYKDPILSLTNAAKNHKVYKLPLGGYRWDPPSQESPLSWMWMANLLHPEVFHYDLRAEMKKAYNTLYHYDLADADIDGVLWTAQQGDAANYDQFKVRQE